MKKIVIGTKGEFIDLDLLLVTRLLLQANSGGGKGWLARKIVEELHGRVQVIVIDPEGEFASLREEYDFILVGKDGETPADVRSAGMLAIKLLELNASAICDLYEMRTMDRHLWVKTFLDALINAPKNLWHPVVIVVDEAHIFAPEKGQGESVALESMIDLASRGRKRGFCAVFATQRLGKISKNATAELQNVLIGSTFQDIDRKRAAETIGISKGNEREFFNEIKLLEPGTFYALGRAISKEPITIKIAQVKTTHPKSGAHVRYSAPAPSDKIKSMLPQLQDLPAQAEAKQKTEAELRKEIAALKKEMVIHQVKFEKVEIKEVKVPVLDDKIITELEKHEARMEKARELMMIAMDKWITSRGEIRKAIESTRQQPAFNTKILQDRLREIKSLDGHKKIPVARALDEHSSNGSSLPIGEKLTLQALIQYPDGLQRNQLTVLTGYKRSSRDAYIARLNAKGYVEAISGGSVRATTAGCQALPDAAPLPTGVDLQQYWLQRLPEGERKILEILIEEYPSGHISRETIDQMTEYKRSSRDAYLARLAAKQLIVHGNKGYVKASDTLFE